MKKILLPTLVVFLAGVLAPAVLAQDDGQPALAYLKGWVVDEACGKKNANEDGADCVRNCYEEKGSALAFYSTERDKLYRIAEPKAALGYIGREISVMGFVDEKSATIKVGSYVDPGTRRSVVGKPKPPEEEGDGADDGS